MTGPSKIDMRVEQRRALTDRITEFVLRPADEARVLETFTAGAHITVQTPSGAMRRYSLVNDGQAPDRYVIAVKREEESRGGSAAMHAEAYEGSVLAIEPPQNKFELDDNASQYLLIAGGIGITPIYAMAQHLVRQGKSFQVIYCARTAEDAAYLGELQEALGNRLTVHHDGGDPGEVYDFWDHFEKPGRAHVYCCGPKPLMEEIEAVSGHWPENQIHFEDFKPVEAIHAEDEAFDVTLAKSRQTVHVPASRTILESLREAGISTVSSCESGTCGTCRCKLVAGEVDHRDMVLMDDEKNDYIMICVSRAREGDLTIEF